MPNRNPDQQRRDLEQDFDNREVRFSGSRENEEVYPALTGDEGFNPPVRYDITKDQVRAALEGAVKPIKVKHQGQIYQVNPDGTSAPVHPARRRVAKKPRNPLVYLVIIFAAIGVGLIIYGVLWNLGIVS